MEAITDVEGEGLSRILRDNVRRYDERLSLTG
jgi:hypothetical protein